MRIPLAISLESRDGAVSKDAKVLNGIVESRGQDTPPILRKRPGLSDLGLVHSGTAQALTYWNSQVIAVIGDSLNTGIPAGYIHTTTWNSSDKGSDVALSNGNLTATLPSSSVHAARSSVSLSSGRWYWEVTLSVARGAIGVANSSFDVGSASIVLSGDANSTAYIPSSGVIQFAAGNQQSVSTATAGDVIGVDLNLSSNTIQFYKNGVALGAAYTHLPAGVLYAAVGGNGGAGHVSTTNFGATAFSYVPGGSSSGLSPTTAGLQFSLQDNGSNAPSSQLMIKNATQAWSLSTAGVVTQITDIDYPGTYAVTLTSLTRSGTTATATTAADTNFQVGSTVVIAGATPSTYNGSQVVTAVTPASDTTVGPIEILITRSGTTATATSVSEPHGFTNGQTVTIKGAGQAAYNGDHVITWISATSFSFTVTVISSASATTAPGSPAVATWYDRSSYGGNNASTGSYATFRIQTPYGNTLANADTVNITGLSGSGLNDGAYTVSNRTATSYDITTTLTVGTSVAGFTPMVITRTAATLSSMVRQTDRDYPTFLLTFSAPHKINTATSDLIVISGSTDSIFNGTFYVTGLTSTTAIAWYYDSGRNSGVLADDPTTPASGTITAEVNTKVGPSFTFSISGSPATPATGTITATGGRSTVPGIAYLDGYFVVMDVNGVLYNSREDDPSNWDPLEYITALAETGNGKAIARSLNYIVAFKEWSTELFWNAGNEPPGSPLGPVGDGLILVGCASGDSVVKMGEGILAWVSQTRENGRAVHVMQGRVPQKVSSPDVDRILRQDDLATVRACAWNVGGHQLYLLTLESSNITLCYDLQSGSWTTWSSLTAGTPVSVSSITRSGTTATVNTSTAHGLSDGDPVLIAGANQSDYNGIFQISYVSTTSFTIEVSNSPTSPATGTITATPYTESYFKFTKYTDAGGQDMVLHESDGHLYQIDPDTYRDNGVPINLFVRTARLDGNTDARKTMPAIRLIGDKVSDYVMVRWSDDDSSTFKAYRNVDMSNDQPETRRCGSFRRRSLEFRHIGNTAQRWEAAELDIGGQ